MGNDVDSQPDPPFGLVFCVEPQYIACAVTASGTTKLTTDALKFLPAKLRKQWKGSRVYFVASGETLVVRKTLPPKQTYAEALAQFRRLGKSIKRGELREAIARVRGKR